MGDIQEVYLMHPCVLVQSRCLMCLMLTVQTYHQTVPGPYSPILNLVFSPLNTTMPISILIIAMVKALLHTMRPFTIKVFPTVLMIVQISMPLSSVNVDLKRRIVLNGSKSQVKANMLNLTIPNSRNNYTMAMTI